MEQIMKSYQALFILKPSSEESVKKSISSIQEAITKNNGKVLKEENWGKKEIAYPIKKHKEAVYYKVDFSIEPSLVSKIDKAYRLNSSILRTLIFKEE